jgi:hypothetical protein
MVRYEIGGLPALLEAKVDYSEEFFAACETQIKAPRSAVITVKSSTGHAGLVPYDLNVTARPADLPGDWGEPLEGGTTTPECAKLTPDPGPRPHTRPIDITRAAARSDVAFVREPTAWQHVDGDVDTYHVTRFPADAPRPLDQPACPFDVDPGITISAPGMELTGTAGAQESRSGTSIPFHGVGSVEVPITDLDTDSDRQVEVRVTNPTGHRAPYQLTVGWSGGHYLTAEACKELADKLRLVPQQYQTDGWIPIISPRPIETHDLDTDPQVNPNPFELDLFDQGAWVAVGSPGESIDTVVSAPPDVALSARLFDGDGVLLTELAVPTGAASSRGANVPSGLNAIGRLQAGGLVPGGVYVVQFVPTGAAPAPGATVSVALPPAFP